MKTELRVWDGTNPMRTSLSDIKNPDHTDYLYLVAELQRLQQAFISTVQNITLMPNLQGELDKALVAITTLQETTAALVPPQDLKDKIANLEKLQVDGGSREKFELLHLTCDDLRAQIDRYQLQILKLQETFAVQVTAFQSKVWNTIKTFETDVQSQLDENAKKLEEVLIKLSILTLQQELNK